MAPSKPKTKKAKDIEQLLSKQTIVILNAVDHRLEKQNASLISEMDGRFAAQDKRIEERFVAQNIALSAAMDKRLAKLEERFMQKLSGLTNTLEIPATHDRHGRGIRFHETRRQSHQSSVTRKARRRPRLTRHATEPKNQ